MRIVSTLDSGIKIYSTQTFIAMRKAGKLAAQTIDFITPFVKAGESTGRLNDLCHDFITSHDAIPAPLNYRGFPKSICTSVNHVVCHGIPDYNKILQNGDIINVDVTVIKDGLHGDTSKTFIIGDNVSVKCRRLVEVTKKCLMEAISICKPGIHVGNIGAVIQNIAEDNGFSIVRDFCGHGIGENFHEPPSIFHFGNVNAGPILKQGMLFTIEPMLNIGSPHVKILSDGWTAVTRDKKMSAQFEHTIGITAKGAEVFTLYDD